MTVEKESLNLIEERKAELKRILPEIFVDGKIDINKLREALGDYVETGSERYSFNWAGRTQSLRIRDRRSKATLAPCKKESIDFDNTKNVFIEGENLEVLKILQKSYQGKVKMIYIDPPYNTGNDFVYKDDFSDSLKNYLRYTGQITGNGEKTSTNTETSGRYHSNWISMMYPRLFLARNILSEDGVIFVSIDDNEVHNLRMIMNEIFGEENFVSQIIVVSNKGGQDYLKVAKVHEYLLCYQKSDELGIGELVKDVEYRFEDKKGKYEARELRNRNPKFDRSNRPNLFYPIYVNQNIKDKSDFCPISLSKTKDYSLEVLPKNSEGKEGCWRWGKQLVSENILFDNPLESNVVAKQRRDGGWNIYEKYRKTTAKVKSLWDESEVRTEKGTKDIRELFTQALFDHPKPIDLVKKATLLTTDTQNEDIIMDFFAGSGTTAHAVLAQNAEDGGNRKFILVQLPEPTPEDSEARKAGYKTIADICKERIRRAIETIKEEKAQKKLEEQSTDIGFKVFKLSKSNCFVWDEDAVSDKESLAKHIEESAKGATSSDKEALLFELMLREGFKLDSEVKQIAQDKNKICKVSDEEHSLWMCFDENIDEEVIKKLSLNKDDKLIVLDTALTDTQKVNLTRKLRVETV